MPNEEREKLIGGDIEFIITDSHGQIISPWFGSCAHDCHIGTDGCPSTGELRPNPTNNPILLADNIKQLVYQLKDIIGVNSHNAAKVQVGSCIAGSPVGFHIHFSGFGMPTDRVKMFLKKYVSIPLAAIEDVNQARRRHGGSATGYGTWDHHRETEQGHTGGDHWEFRIPYSFIHDEKLTKAVLSLAWITMLEAKEHRTRKVEFDIFKYTDKSFKEHGYYTVRFFHNASHYDPLKVIAKDVMNEVKTFAHYTEFQEHIDYLDNLIQNNLTINWQDDLFQGWGMGLMDIVIRLSCSSDDGLDEICKVVGKRRLTKSMFVYGLHQRNDFDVAINDPTWNPIIEELGLKVKNNYDAFSNKADIIVGFHANLRKARPEICKAILMIVADHNSRDKGHMRYIREHIYEILLNEEVDSKFQHPDGSWTCCPCCEHTSKKAPHTIPCRIHHRVQAQVSANNEVSDGLAVLFDEPVSEVQSSVTGTVGGVTDNVSGSMGEIDVNEEYRRRFGMSALAVESVHESGEQLICAVCGHPDSVHAGYRCPE